MSDAAFADRLRARANRVGLSVDAAIVPRLEAYYTLLARWNDTINLAGLPLQGFTDEGLDRLIVEPLAAATHVALPVSSLIDIGSGGGSPAIPLALALGVDLLRMVESRSRKSTFLREAARAAGIERAEVLVSRFEALLTQPQLQSHDLLSLRAVRVGPDTLSQLQHFVRPGGQLALFRSESDPEALTGRRVVLDGERHSHLVLIERI